MKLIKEKIKLLSEQFYDEVISIRRHLHQHPELSFKEYETSKYIQQKLSEFGIPFQNGVVETGVVALIEGRNPNKKCIALRADIDALPINEMNEVSYKSQNNGVMHACGHDVHTASLLGVAKILNELKEEWEGSMKLIFQPGEEKLPGGASLMINEGVLENPTVHKIIGQHVSPELERGFYGIRGGLFMASADEIYIDVFGKGGHAALPEGIVNPLVLSSKIILALYDVFDNISDTPSVFSLGLIEGGTAGNIIPDCVSLQGTFRAMDEKWRQKAHQIINHTCHNIAHQMGGQCKVNIKIGYPCLINDYDFTTQCFDNAIQLVGPKKVIEVPRRMTAEDFAYYSHHVPACFYRLGVGFKNEKRKSLHNPYFDIDEEALKGSIAMMSWLAISA